MVTIPVWNEWEVLPLLKIRSMGVYWVVEKRLLNGSKDSHGRRGIVEHKPVPAYPV